MSILEFFGANHCDEQVSEEQQRDDADGDGFHRSGLKFVAEAHVKSAHDEKQNYKCAKNDVTHKLLGQLEPHLDSAASHFLLLLARELARPFAEMRVEPVHTRDNDDSSHDEFAHKVGPTLSEIWQGR
jgi:hypothetical protein